MRRNYISPEFKYKKVSGTFNMLELRSFFGSKMVDVEDNINIKNNNIIYYNNGNNEQLDFIIESTLVPFVYNSFSSKKERHSIKLDPTQSLSDKDRFTKWIIEIDLKSILFDYIFAKFKEERTFEGINNTKTIHNSVDIAIDEYIESNLWSRYTFDSIELYIVYIDLKSQNTRRYIVDFDLNAELPFNLLVKMESVVGYDKKALSIKFKQEKPSSEFRFNYYFNLSYKRL